MDRTIQPEIQTLKNFRILPPVRMTLPNGIPLTVINAGEQEVVRIDVLFAGGRWQQSQKLQALFTNRMLREGTKKYTAATIAEKLDYILSLIPISNNIWSILPKLISWHTAVCCSRFTVNSIHVVK